MNSPKRILARRQIQNQFDRAAKTYDSAAGLQRRMGESLIQQIVESDFAKPVSLIDLGCGTGDLLRHLANIGFEHLTGLDLSEEMIRVASIKTPTADFLHADIESVPCSDGVFDIAVSNAALQWCDNESAARETFRILKPYGRCYLTAFTFGTLGQWDHAFASNGFESRVHTMAESVDIQSAFEHAGFVITDVQEQKETASFDSVDSMFQSIKRLGATNAMESRSHRMSRSEYETLKRHFRTELETNKQLELDFVWVRIAAQKIQADCQVSKPVVCD